jgi:divalent metal cation (Fe/Co/Zn/Cd) transporter
LQFIPGFPLSPHRAAQSAGVLLFALAAVVAVMATLALGLRLRPDVSPLGMAITVAALIAMPILAQLKRQQAVRHNNPALAADAIQSAACAYLAAITLAGLAVNALFQIYWFDPLAALACLPFLVKEARTAWHGVTCSCC